MNRLQEIRTHHDNFSLKTLDIRLDLFDPHVYLAVQLKYEKFLETMYYYFPYMMKSQFYQMYGKSKNTNISAVNELIDMKVVREVQIAGNNYILPISRMSQYFEKQKQPARFKVKPSLHTLFDHFMRAELFVRKGILVYPTPNEFFGTLHTGIVEAFKKAKLEKDEIDKQIQELEQNIALYYDEQAGLNKEKIKEVGLNGIKVVIDQQKELFKLREVQTKRQNVLEGLQQEVRLMLSKFEAISINKEALELLAIDWKNKKGFNKTIYPVNNKQEQHEFIKMCLSTLPDRSCYFKNIVKNQEQFHLELAITHYDDSTKKRYVDLLDDISRICSCFTKGTFSIQLLTESEYEKERATTIIKEALNDRLERNVKEDYLQYMNRNYCSKYTVTNTNIQRYLVKHNIGETIVDDTDFSELEKVLSQLA